MYSNLQMKKGTS